ncbi:hypothetical protein ABZY36_05100 [Streptomyces sp. NPDC006627]|uniref:hypothetical protein n=1 Tax=Streptomyces sp. NPDC006627 TaxID=3154679 RepID=UPI0033A5C178
MTALNDHPVAYPHLRGPDLTHPSDTPDPGVFTRHRRRFDGPLIVNNGFDQAGADTAVREGVADAVSFARHFVANPDLVSRFAPGRESAAGDPATYWTVRRRGVGGGVARGAREWLLWPISLSRSAPHAWRMQSGTDALSSAGRAAAARVTRAAATPLREAARGGPLPERPTPARASSHI